MRATLHVRPSRRRAAGQGFCELRRRNRVDQCADAGDRNPDRPCLSPPRNPARRPCAGLAAQQRRLSPRLVRSQLSRRRVRADQPRLQREPAAARAEYFGGAPCSRACRSASATWRNRAQISSRSRRARWTSPAGRRADGAWSQCAGKRRCRSPGAGARDRALGSAVDHPDIGDDRPVEGRAVLLRTPIQHGGARRLSSLAKTVTCSTCRCSIPAA